VSALVFDQAGNLEGAVAKFLDEGVLREGL